MPRKKGASLTRKNFVWRDGVRTMKTRMMVSPLLLIGWAGTIWADTYNWNVGSGRWDTSSANWAGAGATMAKIKWEYKDYGTGDSDTLNNTLVYPHIKAGAEWRPNKTFGLGLDLGYNFGGQFKAAGAFKRDISGFEGFLAARFYFL